MEKLSSGLRINKAGDDAAGLAISEKMRGQIRGLDMAAKNSQDGISLIQTAEGALNETHSILQRMRELATQASNDTNTVSDRGEIQKEINQLTSEINRIGNTIEFNTQKLLNGGEKPADLTAKATGTGAVTLTGAAKEVTGEWTISVDTLLADGDDIEIAGVAIDAKATGASATELDVTTNDDKVKQANAIADILGNNSTFNESYTVSKNNDGTITIREKAGKATGNAVTPGGTNLAKLSASEKTASVKEADPTLKIDTAFVAGDSLKIGDRTFTFGNDDSFDINVGTFANKADQSKALAALLAKENGVKSAVSDGTDTITIKQAGGAGFKASFQVGANEGQSMSIEVGHMRAKALGLTSTAGSVGFTNTDSVTNGTNNDSVEAALDVSTHENAAKAITVINNAIEKVSAQRSNLGAFQNRLEHTINNLNTFSENLTAAESRILDVDYALAA
ncbi:flagellin N-terminal helical domain-containing protein [Heyndrickxia oleronia]|jgi:flagellin|uniref:flagellin N-terminal helical domain-containing protein n=1 Tax=Heyndrickxia oleronia TaxID=38875 RepID=UPI003C6D5EEA